jgi:hypothetical protein
MAAGFAAARLGKVVVAGGSSADLPKVPEVFRDSQYGRYPADIGELLAGLASDVQQLIRGEIALGRAELD